tara:strand:+ start:739 stop:1473 length:735 start_codon:yes stop_codon:yes gene_type:complete
MNRIYHPWDKWECYRAGFYNTVPPNGITPDRAREMYAIFLCDVSRFEEALERVIHEWRYSCEHFLSNSNINRIAWLGQASMCIAAGVPSYFRAGFKLLSKFDRERANAIALRWLHKWVEEHTMSKEEFTLSYDTNSFQSASHSISRTTPRTVQGRINEYIRRWSIMGYPAGIPDVVPDRLSALGLAPSYKAICLALLKNDLHLISLGFTAPTSKWYGTLKRIEINNRMPIPSLQQEFDFYNLPG